MTPFRMRLLVVAFLAIATAITVNAIYFQEGQRFAVSTKSAGAKKAETRVAAQAAEEARGVVTAALPDPAPAPPAVVHAAAPIAPPPVQTETPRPQQLETKPAEPILSALYFLEASGRNRLPSVERFERDQALVQEVQDLLAKLGYTSGPVDGHLDGKTRDAIKKFETDRSLKAGGRLTERVLLEMVKERGKPFLSKG
jgi:hypothetical protein